MAYKSVYQRAMERWERTKDFATPEERKLLDQLQCERPDMGKLKVNGRGPFAVLFCLRTPTKAWGSTGGVYCLSVPWIRKEIIRRRRKRLREEREEIKNLIGAYI